MKNENPPAFPLQSVTLSGEPNSPEHGMTLRDWFAGQIGCGYLSGVIIDGEVGSTLQEPEVLARKFYRIADAMLAARKEPTP
jgi:hypothetical protein